MDGQRGRAVAICFVVAISGCLTSTAELHSLPPAGSAAAQPWQAELPFRTEAGVGALQLDLRMNEPSSCEVNVQFETRAAATDVKAVSIVLARSYHFAIGQAFMPIAAAYVGEAGTSIPAPGQAPTRLNVTAATTENFAGEVSLTVLVLADDAGSASAVLVCTRQPDTTTFRQSTEAIAFGKSTMRGTPQALVWTGFGEASTIQSGEAAASFSSRTVHFVTFQRGGDGWVELVAPENTTRWEWSTLSTENDVIVRPGTSGDYEIHLERTQVRAPGATGVGEGGVLLGTLFGLNDPEWFGP